MENLINGSRNESEELQKVSSVTYTFNTEKRLVVTKSDRYRKVFVFMLKKRNPYDQWTR